MKRIAFAFLLIGFTLVSCKEDSGASPLTLNSINKIQFQETLSDGKISVKFLEVISDSRCPASANCVWEGNAEMKFELFESRQIIPFTIFANNQQKLGMRSDTIISQYRFEVMSLEPYPETTNKISPADYLVKILVEQMNTPHQN
ncbi:MAG: hypothetical protein ABJG78_20530 [Cyclobacteriaceae bacterium]